LFCLNDLLKSEAGSPKSEAKYSRKEPGTKSQETNLPTQAGLSAGAYKFQGEDLNFEIRNEMQP
jgi:hypothetical protein